MPRTVRFEVSPETYARLRQARQLLDGERGHRLDDDALVAALCEAVLDGTEREDSRGRAKFQIAVTTCRDCRRATQEGAGAQVAIDAAALARAECDAQRLGALDGVPARATQDVAPRVQRLVWRRDGGRCRVPGCRSSRHLELHHVVARVDGGDHAPENLTLLCDGHHAAHHRGVLTITGKAPDRLVFGRPDREPAMSHVGPIGPTGSSVATVQLRTEARAALIGLGWRPKIASDAVDVALLALGPDTPLERLIFEALRRCN